MSLNALSRLPVPKICHVVACLRFRGSTLSRAQLWRAFCDAGRSSCRIFPVSVHAQLRMSLFFARFFFKKTPGSTRGYKRQFCGISPVVWEIWNNVLHNILKQDSCTKSKWPPGHARGDAREYIAAFPLYSLGDFEYCGGFTYLRNKICPRQRERSWAHG